MAKVTPVFQRYSHVRRSEVPAVIAAGLCFFFILTALMVIKPAREALGMRRGIEEVRWLFVGTALVTLAVNPLFAFLVSRTRRMVFVATTYAFFALSLIAFYAILVTAPKAVGEVSGMVFFVWFSVFNLFATMVFWALMADRFSLDQSKRLFGVIAIGGTFGAIAGPWLASRLAKPLGTAGLLPVSAALLGLAVASAWFVVRLGPTPGSHAAEPGDASSSDDRAVIGGSAWAGFSSVVKSPYLLGISGYVLIMTVVATFLYFTRLQMVAALGEDLDMRTGVFARIDLITQTATLVLQALVTGQLMKRLGVAVTLALLPATVALGFVGLAVSGSLAALVAVQAAFNAVQRAVTRPARETLFTVVPRADKYKAKAFTDTFVYRTGDVLGSQVEGILGRLAPGLAVLVAVTVPLSVAWAALGLWLGRAQQRRAFPTQASEASADGVRMGAIVHGSEELAAPRA